MSDPSGLQELMEESGRRMARAMEYDALRGIKVSQPDMGGWRRKVDPAGSVVHHSHSSAPFVHQGTMTGHLHSTAPDPHPQYLHQGNNIHVEFREPWTPERIKALTMEEYKVVRDELRALADTTIKLHCSLEEAEEELERQSLRRQLLEQQREET